MKLVIERKSQFRIGDFSEGETLENKVRRMMSNKEPIKDGAPLIYEENKDKIPEGYNPRTDRWDIGLYANTIVEKSNIVKSQESVNPTESTESTQGTTKEN